MLHVPLDNVGTVIKNLEKSLKSAEKPEYGGGAGLKRDRGNSYLKNMWVGWSLPSVG